MENKGYKIVVTSLVPRAVGYDGKSGALVRLAEILKRLGRLDGLKITAVSSDKRFFDFLRESRINFESISVKSNLRFKSLIGLCLKSLLIIAKSFFVLKLDFLESKVLEFLKNDAMRKKVGKDGKEFVRKYLWEKVSEQEYEILKGS
ncbi:MAG: hypothetical protein WC643_03785 [Parcubacteria group bacterium]|jgi:hypothetical protein